MILRPHRLLIASARGRKVVPQGGAVGVAPRGWRWRSFLFSSYHFLFFFFLFSPSFIFKSAFFLLLLKSQSLLFFYYRYWETFVWFEVVAAKFNWWHFPAPLQRHWKKDTVTIFYLFFLFGFVYLKKKRRRRRRRRRREKARRVNRWWFTIRWIIADCNASSGLVASMVLLCAIQCVWRMAAVSRTGEFILRCAFHAWQSIAMNSWWTRHIKGKLIRHSSCIHLGPGPGLGLDLGVPAPLAWLGATTDLNSSTDFYSIASKRMWSSVESHLAGSLNNSALFEEIA